MPGSVRLMAAAGALGVCATWSNPGHAEDESKQRCVLAYEDAQTSKRKGHLVDAKQELLYCSSPQCPEVMHGDCQRWLSEVESSMPTVVFRVETSSGSAVESASVSIDGGDPARLDGRALSVDPGKHTATFSAKGLRSTSKAFDFSEGEKLRREIVVLEPTPGPGLQHGNLKDEPTPSGEQNTGPGLMLPIILASSLTILGGVGATYFGLTARAEDSDLDACSPNCARDRVDRVKRDYLIANASLGLTAAGLVTTTILLVVELRATKTSRSTRLGVGAYRNQLSLSVGGNF